MSANYSSLFQVAIRYAGSESGDVAKSQLLYALRRLEQLESLATPQLVTADEMSNAWFDTHNREGQEPTREALNAILANRGAIDNTKPAQPEPAQRTPEERLSNIYSALADNAEAMSDEDLVADAVACGVDIAEEARETRRRMLEAVAKVRGWENSGMKQSRGERQASAVGADLAALTRRVEELETWRNAACVALSRGKEGKDDE